MTVKNLILHLKKWNPDAEVRIGRYGGPVDMNIKGISVYLVSRSGSQDFVYLGGENIPLSNSIEKTTMKGELMYDHSNFKNN